MPPENYIETLQTPVPFQDLSIVSNLKVLKKVEKRYVEDILKSGSSIIPQRVNAGGKELQSEELSIIMRKFGLILLRDIKFNVPGLFKEEIQ